jgi:hypothetical protein
VDLPDHVRSIDVPQLARAAIVEAALLEQSAHRPIEQNRTPTFESVTQSVHLPATS